MPSHPTKRLTEPAWEALTEALATFYWYKDDLKAFLYRQLSDEHALLGAIDFSLSKRQVAASLVRMMGANEGRYQSTAIDMLVELSRFDPAFPRLGHLDDGESKVARARAAHADVVAVVAQYSELAAQREELQRELDERHHADSARRSHEAVLAGLREEFFSLHAMSDPQERGRRFEPFLNALFELHDLDPRAAYDLEHEQIDGAFTFDTDDYLLEARWWKGQMQPGDVHPFRVKVESKAKHTFGLFISVNGFTDGAVELYSQATPIIFMIGTDLLPILEGRIGLAEVLHRKRRFAAETGKPLLPVRTMLG